ncbi:MAG: hypothetical protein AAF847_13705 [Bacteroidota bacterium]
MQPYPAFMSSNRNAKLTAIFFLAFLLLSFPLLGIFGEGSWLWGIPNWYLYIFVVWIGIIFFLSRAIQQKEEHEEE